MNTHLPTPPRISPLPFENLSAPNSTSTDNMGQFQYPSNPPSTTGINPSLFSTQPMFPDITPAENILNLNTYPLFNDLSPTQNAPEPPSNPLENQWAWDVVSLGLNEELPPEDLTDKLYPPKRCSPANTERNVTLRRHIKCYPSSTAQGSWQVSNSHQTLAFQYPCGIQSGHWEPRSMQTPLSVP